MFFERFILIGNKESLRRGTLKRRFKFWNAERIVKALDLETISSDIYEKKFGCELISFIFLLVSSLTKEKKMIPRQWWSARIKPYKWNKITNDKGEKMNTYIVSERTHKGTWFNS